MRSEMVLSEVNALPETVARFCSVEMFCAYCVTALLSACIFIASAMPPGLSDGAVIVWPVEAWFWSWYWRVDNRFNWLTIESVNEVPAMRIKLLFQIDDRLQHLVRGRD